MNLIINFLIARVLSLLTVLFTVLLTVLLTHLVRSWYENKKAIMSIKGELEENLHRANSLIGKREILNKMKDPDPSEPPVISFSTVWWKASTDGSREYWTSSPRLFIDAWSLNKRAIFEEVGKEVRRKVTTIYDHIKAINRSFQILEDLSVKVAYSKKKEKVFRINLKNRM